MTSRSFRVLENSLLFVLATILTGLMSAIAISFVLAHPTKGRKPKRAFLADKQNTLNFYKVFSRAYDILNPHFYTNEMRNQIVRLIKGKQLRVLDVGCGTGYTSEGILLRKDISEVVGLDINPVQLGRAAKKLAHYGSRATLSRGDAENLPYLDNSFDAVVSVGAIENFPNPERSITEMTRVVKNGGVVVVGGPEFGWFRKVALDRFFYTPSVEEACELISKSGLSEERATLVGVETMFVTGRYVVVAMGKKPSN